MQNKYVPLSLTTFTLFCIHQPCYHINNHTSPIALCTSDKKASSLEVGMYWFNETCPCEKDTPYIFPLPKSALASVTEIRLDKKRWQWLLTSFSALELNEEWLCFSFLTFDDYLWYVFTINTLPLSRLNRSLGTSPPAKFSSIFYRLSFVFSITSSEPEPTLRYTERNVFIYLKRCFLYRNIIIWPEFVDMLRYPSRRNNKTEKWMKFKLQLDCK